MPMFHRSGLSNASGPATAARRRAAPSCRGGASSMLRLAQPATPRPGHLTNWLSRAASVLAPSTAPVLAVRPSEFAPSAWLVGH